MEKLMLIVKIIPMLWKKSVFANSETSFKWKNFQFFLISSQLILIQYESQHTKNIIEIVYSFKE